MKSIRPFISCTILALTFTSFQVVHGTEEPLIGIPKKPSGIQLAKTSEDRLEATLGTGNNVLLKVDVGLESFKRQIDEDQVTVSARLFLTDFTSFPTGHPAVHFVVKVDCELTPLKCVLPDKPTSFNSYTQFTHWLEQGYFTNQVSITYDFHVDLQELAPSLAQYLFFFSPSGYRFIGTYVIDNPKIIPDSCTPKISYVSERGNTNATTVTLGGILYLNKKSYPIMNHHQIFQHRMIEEKVFKKDNTKKNYCHKWIAQYEITSKVTYEEFPIRSYEAVNKNWPDAPSETYSIVQQKPGVKEDIQHLSCLDGDTGREVDIVSRGGTFSIISIEDRIKGPNSQEAIVKDEEKLYIMQYRNLKLEKEEAENEIKMITDEIKAIKQKYEKYATEEHYMLKVIAAIKKEVEAIESKTTYGEGNPEPSLEMRRLINPSSPDWQYTEEHYGGGKKRIRTIYSSITGQLAIRDSFSERYEKKGCIYPFGIIPIQMALEKKEKEELGPIRATQRGLREKERDLREKVRRNMEWYAEVTNTYHPRWDEFRQI